MIEVWTARGTQTAISLTRRNCRIIEISTETNANMAMLRSGGDLEATGFLTIGHVTFHSRTAYSNQHTWAPGNAEIPAGLRRFLAVQGRSSSHRRPCTLDIGWAALQHAPLVSDTGVDPFRVPSDLQILRLLIISAITANEEKSLCKVICCVALGLCRFHYTPFLLAIALLYSFVLG